MLRRGYSRGTNLKAVWRLEIRGGIHQMKRLLLAGAAFVALTSASSAADMPVYPVEPAVVAPVDIWSGFFLGIQGGWAFTDLSGDVGGTAYDVEADDFVIGLYYGRNWQFDNWILGIDSSISYIGIEEDDVDGAGTDIEANVLGLSRLKAGYAFGNWNLFVAGGLATTWFDASEVGDDDDSFGFGWTVGGGVEAMFAENWSARVEYIYANIEDDDMTLTVNGDVDAELETHIIRGGIAYHF